MKRNAAAFTIGSALLWYCSTAGAETLIEQASRWLEPQPLVQGTFEQTSTVAALSAPMTSSGRFFVDRDLGVFWEVFQPIQTQFVWPAPGTASTARTPSALSWISNLLSTALRGDLAPIGQQFEVTGEVSASEWRLQLTPKQKALQRAIRRIELNGTTVVKRVRVVQANDDTVGIEFSQVEHPTELPGDVRDALLHP